MIATVLDRPSARADQRAAQWRQLVDLLAQRRGGGGDGGSGASERAFVFLRSHRAEVTLGERERTAAALGGLRVAPELIAFFGEDHPAVASPLLRSARLTAAEWVDLLPGLTPTGRAILRHRRDLPSEVVRALAGFGPSDFVLGSSAPSTQPVAATVTAPAAPPPEPRPSQIRELVERIEAFQRIRESGVPDPAAPRAPSAEFRWETGPEGVVLWVDGAPRGPIVGQSIAAIAERGQHGVDGQAAGAFHKRAPFRDARFSVAGDGAGAGDWRISGVPYFDSHRGNFLGYRGTARRPRLGEVAVASHGQPADEAGLFGTSLPPDSLRQLTHELRTPLNAIIGFAEMIEGQYLGAAETTYRGRAAGIVAQARRLLSAVDDLDAAARVEPGRDGPEPRVDLVALLVRLHEAYALEAAGNGARIALQIENDLPPALLDAAAAERMLARMLAGSIGLAESDETICAELRGGTMGRRPVLRLAVDRPRAIAGLDEMALLHPGYTPDGDWPGAPALGLGFALRLVRKLAEAAGGALEVSDTRFFLHVPAAVGQAQDGGAGEGAG